MDADADATNANADAIRAKYVALETELTERSRRICAATEAWA